MYGIQYVKQDTIIDGTRELYTTVYWRDVGIRMELHPVPHPWQTLT